MYTYTHTHTCIYGCAPAGPPLAQFIGITIYVSPPLPPVERDILPSPAAQVQFIYHYIGITIYGSPSSPCGTGHPSFSCGPPPLWNGTSFLLLLPWFSFFTNIAITVYVCPLPPRLWNGTSFLLSPLPPVERDILPSPAALVGGSSAYTLKPETIVQLFIRILLRTAPSTNNHTNDCL